MSKNSEPARPTATMASIDVINACVRASRVKGDSGVAGASAGLRRAVPNASCQPRATGPSYGRALRPGRSRGPARSDLRGLELVAESPDRDDPRRVRRVVFDLGAQALDVHVERLGVAHVVRAPDPVDQRLAGQHPSGVLEQELQELELLQRQLHELVAD